MKGYYKNSLFTVNHKTFYRDEKLITDSIESYRFWIDIWSEDKERRLLNVGMN